MADNADIVGEQAGQAATQIDKDFFFQAIKDNKLFLTLTQLEVNGMNDIIDYFISKYTDLRWLAYVLATVYHETAETMQPVKEYGGEKYLKSKKYYPYYGRDLCQTTWIYNYQKVKDFSGIDVVSNPDLIGQMPLAAKVAIEFMVHGWYTGKKLQDYFNSVKEDYVNARKIINGLDKAELIAGYGKKFFASLKTL